MLIFREVNMSTGNLKLQISGMRGVVQHKHSPPFILNRFLTFLGSHIILPHCWSPCARCSIKIVPLWSKIWMPRYYSAKIVVFNFLAEGWKMWRTVETVFGFKRIVENSFLLHNEVVDDEAGNQIDIFRDRWSWIKSFQHTNPKLVSFWRGGVRLHGALHIWWKIIPYDRMCVQIMTTLKGPSLLTMFKLRRCHLW